MVSVSVRQLIVEPMYAFASSATRDERDAESVRLRKATAFLSAMYIAPAAIIWGVLYVVSGESMAALVPLAYTPFTVVNVVVFRVLRNYRLFEFVQLSLYLVLPLWLMFALGGFTSSSAVGVWSLVTPMGAIVYSSRSMSIFWFFAFIGGMVMMAVVDPYYRHDNGVADWLRVTFFAGNILGPSSIAFFLLAYFVKQNDVAYGLLERERQRSERLLQNVLPASIAARLKDDTENVADSFENVSILFADMVGSTQLASKLSPTEMVKLLNEIFSRFDEITLRHGVEKISTSGDNYVVAAGVPESRADHARVIVDVALEMQELIEQCKESDNEAIAGLTMRFGINSGPAVAAVVGQRNFHYDVWGDAVNVAARMESSGEPGFIHVSEATYELIKNDYSTEYRGEQEIKGKGTMKTWWVTGRK